LELLLFRRNISTLAGVPDAENRTMVSSFFWTQYRNVTEGQTDGQNPLASTAVSIVSNADAL